jgi:rhodanese-related sulfurtransferase
LSNQFAKTGLHIDGIDFLLPREAGIFLEGDAILIDLREGLEKNGREFNVKNLISLSYLKLQSEFSSLPKDRPLIVADCVGVHSKEVVRFLLAQGYESVASLIGGMVDWEKDGMPVVVDPDEELTGQCGCRLRRKRLGPPPSER